MDFHLTNRQTYYFKSLISFPALRVSYWSYPTESLINSKVQSNHSKGLLQPPYYQKESTHYRAIFFNETPDKTNDPKEN